MIPGKLYRSVTYSTPLFENIKFSNRPFGDGSPYFISNYINSIDCDVFFMVIENIDCFCKVLDANGNIGYIRSNKGDLFKEVKE
jgi:hypothetical protein